MGAEPSLPHSWGIVDSARPIYGRGPPSTYSTNRRTSAMLWPAHEEQRMAQASAPIEVYLEIGKKRMLAGALDWPGWCRGGRDEPSALQALLTTGPRYARVLQSSGIEFQAPADESAFAVVERLAGTTTTDFGAPDVAPPQDTQPVDDAALPRLRTLLQALWQGFHAAGAA